VVSRLKERIEHEQDCPLLSCADIETLLAHFLPRRDNGVDEVIRQMEERHRKRQHPLTLPMQSNGLALTYERR
jgi:hypothetical protein